MPNYYDLEKQALEACEFRGHVMEEFTNNGYRYMTQCEKCGKYAFINTDPKPNEIHISGEAVALGCED